MSEWEWTPSENSHILGFPIRWGLWGAVIHRPRSDLHWILGELERLKIPLETYIYTEEG